MIFKNGVGKVKAEYSETVVPLWCTTSLLHEDHLDSFDIMFEFATKLGIEE